MTTKKLGDLFISCATVNGIYYQAIGSNKAATMTQLFNDVAQNEGEDYGY